MPFKSEKQRKFLWANEPKVAREWAEEEKTLAQLTKRKPKTRKRSK